MLVIYSMSSPVHTLQRVIKDNVLASETISIILPTMAIIPCTIFSIAVRSDPTILYTTCVKNGVLPYLPQLKIGAINVYEPFSTTSNLAYIASGIGIFLYYLPNKAFLHMQMYIVGTLFIILGTGSVAMHAAGSKIGGWEHAVDILSIYAFFTGLTGTSVLGLYHTIRGKPLLPTSRDLIPPFITTVTLLGIGFTVFLWNYINQAQFLVSTSVIMLVSTGTSQGIFAIRSSHNIDKNKLSCFILAFFVCVVPKCIIILTALYLNLFGRVEPGNYQRQCRINDPDIAYRTEIVTRFDLIHGLWHYLTAIFLTSLSLSSQQGLDGIHEERMGIENTRLPCVQWLLPLAIRTDEYVEELISRFIMSAFCLSCILLYEIEASSSTWHDFLLVMFLTILPWWSIYSCWSIYKNKNTLSITNNITV
jgi:hypothetical protein